MTNDGQWPTRKLKTSARLVTERATDAPWKIGLENVEGWTGRLVSSGGDFEGEGIAFKSGDVLFGKLRPYLAKAWVADRNGAAVGDFLVIRPNQDIDSHFLLHHLLSPARVAEVSSASFGSKMPRASWDSVRELELEIPGLVVQAAVLSFLDRETAEIDSFIADQEELIELLTERRAATITHAVTKGLDPSAPMKSSGLGVLDSIPAGWKVWPFTQYAPHRVDYRGATPTKVSGGIPLVTARNVKAGYIDYESSAEYVAPESYADTMRRGRPELGDVLLTMEAPLGNVALVDRTDIALAQRLVKFRVKAGADPRFAVFAMISSYFQHQLLSRATGSTALGIKASKLSELRIAVPSDGEQKAISDYLERETAELDATIADAREAIALSKERRAALISAAVTGKLDVSGRA